VPLPGFDYHRHSSVIISGRFAVRAEVAVAELEPVADPPSDQEAEAYGAARVTGPDEIVFLVVLEGCVSLASPPS
jgi:hypothetical protein